MFPKKYKDYRNIPFATELSSHLDFYTYSSVENLLEKCKEHKDKILKCRTMGILESINGCFYLKDITVKSEASKVRVSMAYIKTSLPSTFIPYVVQLFGSLQFEDQPVIFANIVQVVDTSNGIRLNEALRSITSLHLAKQFNDIDT